MSRTKGPARRGGGVGVFLTCAGAVIGGGVAFAQGNDMSSPPPTVAAVPEATVAPETIVAAEAEPALPALEGGAKALFCDQMGFMSFVQGVDDRLRSPQFPGSAVRSADGLIVLTSTYTVKGIDTEQSSYLTQDAGTSWTFTGFRGTEPVADRCTDITADLAGSFGDLAMAAAWGLPEVERRVAIFDALEDDLRTRLELAEAERDGLLVDAEAMRLEVTGLTTELVTARMAICEIATQTKGLLTNASFGSEGAAPPPRFAELLTEAATMSECIEGTTMTVGTTSHR